METTRHLQCMRDNRNAVAAREADIDDVVVDSDIIDAADKDAVDIVDKVDNSRVAGNEKATTEDIDSTDSSETRLTNHVNETIVSVYIGILHRRPLSFLTLFVQTTLGRTRARLSLPPQDAIMSNHTPEGFAKKRKVVQEIEESNKSKRKTRAQTLPSLPGTQDLVARLQSYAEEGEEEEEGDAYSTHSMNKEVQRTRRWAVVRRNLGYDQLNEKSLIAHIREQTDAVPGNLVNVNDVGKEKDTPSKRSSKRLSELAKRMSQTP
jgi:hypothetical protein